MAIFAPKERIAVFRGGDRQTHRLSLEHGAVVLDALEASNRYQPLDIVLTPNGEWLHNGYLMTPAKLFSHIDGVYNAAIGAAGEDGSLARLCERFGVLQQAAPAHAAHTTWNKHLAIDRVRQAGYRTPPRVLVSAANQGDVHTLAVRLQETFGEHFVVKPAASTGRASVRKANSVTAVADTVRDVLAEYPHCIIEGYIPGQPVTITSVPGLRNTALYHSPVMTWMEDFFSSDAVSERLIPAALSKADKAQLFSAVDGLYRVLELRGAVRTDLVITPAGDVYFLEVNSLSPLTPDAAMTQSLETVGVRPDECIEQQLRALR
jgi:D-alanine-D-alanine ligase